MTVFRHYQLVATPDRADALGQQLSSLKAAVEACGGCDGVDLLRNPADPQRFVFIERWSSDAERKAASALLPAELMRSILAALGEPPVVATLQPYPQPVP